MKAFFLAIACFLLPALALAQHVEMERAGFVTRLGADTIAVERFERGPDGFSATVVLRTPQTTLTHYRLDLDEAGGFRAFEATTTTPDAPSDASAIRHETAVLQGDSLHVQVTEAGATRVQTLPADARVLPFIDMIHWPFELMLQRAADQDSVSQPLFTERGVMAFVVGRGADGHMRVTHPYRGTMVVEVDKAGRLVKLDAGATTRKLAVTRVPDVDVEALARRFAARDAAGKPFGPLAGRGETVATVGGATLSIDYGQPAQRGRALFGALVPWGEVWRTGANRATHLETTADLRFGDVRVPAGTYTLFSIPDENGGMLIINRQTGQNGTAYDAEQDLARIPMAISTLDTPAELFTIAVEETEVGGLLSLRWGTTAFTVPFTVAR